MLFKDEIIYCDLTKHRLATSDSKGGCSVYDGVGGGIGGGDDSTIGSNSQGCGSGYFSNASASTPIASASTYKKRKTTVDNFF